MLDYMHFNTMRLYPTVQCYNMIVTIVIYGYFKYMTDSWFYL